jgi:hypothetical protein
LVSNGAKTIITGNDLSAITNFNNGQAVQGYRFENMQGVSIADGSTQTFEIRATINSLNDVSYTDSKLQMHIPGNIVVNGNAMSGIMVEQSNGTSIPTSSIATFSNNVLTIGKVNTVVQ